VATSISPPSHHKVARGSERSFGLVFTLVFAAVGLFPLLRGGTVRWWAVLLAVAFAAAALLAPQLLRPLNRIWLLIGAALQAVVNPLIMAVIYYAAVVPIGLVLRARGKDPLRLRRDPARKSHWVKRAPGAPMTKQF
jgi:hypothetical protein